MQRLTPYLEMLDIGYADLFAAFEEQSGVLYRRQDSHWNGKGALLAYNVILDAMDIPHNAHERAVEMSVKTGTGDLARSLYGAYARTEWDVLEDIAQSHEIVNGASDWESLTVETESDGTGGSLLMFRDSFGNTLSPLIADAFASGAFSKATIYHLDNYVERYQPDHVIFEIVERNLTNYIYFTPDTQSISGPPVMTALQIDPDILADYECMELPANVLKTDDFSYSGAENSFSVNAPGGVENSLDAYSSDGIKNDFDDTVESNMGSRADNDKNTLLYDGKIILPHTNDEDDTRGNVDIEIMRSQLQNDLTFIYGEIGQDIAEIDDENKFEVIVQLTSGEENAYYETFLTSDGNGMDRGFLAYLPEETIMNQDEIKIIIMYCKF